MSPPLHRRFQAPRIRRDPDHDARAQPPVDTSPIDKSSVFLESLPPIADQGVLGSSIAAALATVCSTTGRGGDAPSSDPVSRRFIQYNERALKHNAVTSPDGMMSDGIRALLRYGVCKEETWPFDIAHLAEEPSAKAYEEARGNKIDHARALPVHLHAMRYCLSSGNAFVFVLEIDDFQPDGDGHVKRPATRDGLSSHAMCCVGYDDSDSTFLVVNSWGPGWGDGGTCRIPYAWMTDPEACSDIWTLRWSPDVDLALPGEPASRAEASAHPSVKVNGVDRPLMQRRPDRPHGRPHMKIAEAGAPLPEPLAAVSLRAKCPPVLDQSGSNSCSAHAYTSALRFLHLRDGADEPLSRLFCYWVTRVFIEAQRPSDDVGCVAVNVITALENYGVCTESAWPYDRTKVALQPPEEAFGDAVKRKLMVAMPLQTLRAIKVSIAAGFPVPLAFPIARSVFDGEDGGASRTHETGCFPLPSAADPAGGDHFVLAIGYDDATGLVEFENSWGTGWGDAGYGYLPYAFFGPTQDTDITSPSVMAMDPWTLRAQGDELNPVADSRLVNLERHTIAFHAEGASVSARRTIKVDGVDHPLVSGRPGKPHGRSHMKIARAGSPLPEPPVAASLRAGCPPILQQGVLQSCVAHAFTTALEFLHVRDGADEPLSRLFCYWVTRGMIAAKDFGDDSGCTGVDAVTALENYGVCTESMWAYDTSKLALRPSQEAFDDAAKRKLLMALPLQTLRAIKLSIAAGFPVPLMFSVARSVNDRDDGGASRTRETGCFPLPSATDPDDGGHCVLAIGYDDATGKVEIANSWGTDWGDAGYGYLAYAFFGPTQDSDLDECQAFDAWTLRSQADELNTPTTA